ncbi:DUF1360 domain-containing protein [Actinokineospora bangkokensis]|uniref:DUF1360 domain-containing protein n=1 Tax=Actinokineospora bangkokensis TaxID=1193682 RepID=A0A1Q9LS24_9PSEU|nr:DUF1360 domain-containing protein [Actinokineospora bangkokensis]OLR94810.1 hypothetical protein BJP25_09255 [Actinokineospora bangkokensis]
MGIAESVKSRARGVRERYARGEDRPLAGYLSALGGYGSLVAAMTAVGRAVGARVPERIAPGDIAVTTLAAHKASRIITKDAVLSPLRSPFVRFEGPAGAGEVNESVTAEGHRHALGELVTCPFCTAVWTTTLLLGGLVIAPRTTRLVSTGLAVVTGVDVLHLLYDRLKGAVEG